MKPMLFGLMKLALIPNVFLAWVMKIIFGPWGILVHVVHPLKFFTITDLIFQGGLLVPKKVIWTGLLKSGTWCLRSTTEVPMVP